MSINKSFWMNKSVSFYKSNSISPECISENLTIPRKKSQRKILMRMLI